MSGTQEPVNENVSTPIGEKMRLIRFRMSRERLSFRDEIRLIPRKVILMLVALFLVAQVAGQVIVRVTARAPWPELTHNMMLLAVAGAVTAVSIPIALIVFLVAYVNRDAARRGMNSTLWTVLVLLLIPAYFVTGFIIYFLVREPLSYNCPQCGASVSARFNFCPACKFNLSPTCPNCRQEVRNGDRYCPRCSRELSEETRS